MLRRSSPFLILLFLVAACCNDESGCKFNDSTLPDRFLGSANATDPSASKLFPAAQSAFRSNCVQCHAAFGGYTEAQWISAGYVVAGQAAQSTIFQRIRGSGVGGPENMPPGIAISNPEIQAIQAWINGLSNGGTTTPPSSGADQRFTAAMAVLNKPSAATGVSCNSCHRVTTTSTFYTGQTVPAFGNFTKDSDFVTAQLVTAGYTPNSWLYRSLCGHGGDIATMPKNDSTSISDADAAILDAWISQIGN